jgi:hypothetical protein
MQESIAMNPLQTERDLVRKQEFVIKQQDVALQDIEKGLGRLKNKVRLCFVALRCPAHQW